MSLKNAKKVGWKTDIRVTMFEVLIVFSHNLSLAILFYSYEQISKASDLGLNPKYVKA